MKGQSAIEYILLLVLVAIVIATLFMILGPMAGPLFHGRLCI